MAIDEGPTFKNFFIKNLPWLLGIIFSTVITLSSLYITTLILPLKQDIAVLAQSVSAVTDQTTDLRKEGSIKAQLNEQRIQAIEGNVLEIKQSLSRIEDKLDEL